MAWVAGATAMVAGCYPLEQTSLIYASKHQVGVHVTGGTADAPGIDIVLGYKGLDIAMVPVAVAKHCNPQSKSDCDKQQYKLVVITGDREERTDNGDLATDIAGLRTTIKADEDQREKSLVTIADIDRQLAQFEKREELLKRLADIDEQRALVPADQSALADELDAERSTRLEALEVFDDVKNLDVAAMKELRQTVQRQAASLETKIATERGQLDSLTQQMRMESAGQRRDALSVYGTFSGSTEGRTNEAKLSAGKVFATGVAAQYLSETAGTANCLASVAAVAEKIVDPAKRDALLAQVRDLCVLKHDGS